MVISEFVKSVTDVRIISPRILSVDLVLLEKMVTIILYLFIDPRVVKVKKIRLYNNLSAKIQIKNENDFVLGDFKWMCWKLNQWI